MYAFHGAGAHAVDPFDAGGGRHDGCGMNNAGGYLAVGAVAELHGGEVTPLFHADELGVLQGNLERRLFEAGNRVARVGGEEFLDGGGGRLRLGRGGLNVARRVRGSVLPGVGAGGGVVLRRRCIVGGVVGRVSMNCPLNTCITRRTRVTLHALRSLVQTLVTRRGGGSLRLLGTRKLRVVLRVRHGTLNLVQLQTELTGHLTHVGGAQVAVLDAGNNRGDGAHRQHAAFKGRQIVLGEGRINRELEERAARSNQRAHGGVALVQAQVAGVHAVLGNRHEGLRDEALILLEGGHGGFLSCGVAVEGEDDFAAGAVVGNHAAHHLDVAGTERGTAGGNGGGDAGEVCRHDVRVAFHDDDLLILGHIAFCQVDAVKHLGFLVQLSLGGVQVFGALVVVKEAAGTKADGLAGNGADGPDNAAAEAVVQAAVALGEHAGRLQLLIGEALGAKVLKQVVPAARGVADTEFAGGCGVETAGAEEALRLLRVRRVEVAFEELGGNLVRVEQAAAHARLVAVAGLTALVVQGVADARGKALHRLNEAGVFHRHDEGVHVTGFTATEAVVRADLRAHIEGGRALVVERAQPLEGAYTGAFEAHVAFNDFADIGTGADFVNVFFAD